MRNESKSRGDRIHAVILLAIAPALILLYWLAFFLTDATKPDFARFHLDPNVYLSFESAFPLPDAFVAITSALAGGFLVIRDSKAVLFGLISSGGFLFLALIDASFNWEHELYTLKDSGMVLEAVVNVTCAAGAIWSGWRLWNHPLRGRHLLHSIGVH